MALPEHRGRGQRLVRVVCQQWLAALCARAVDDPVVGAQGRYLDRRYPERGSSRAYQPGPVVLARDQRPGLRRQLREQRAGYLPAELVDYFGAKQLGCPVLDFVAKAGGRNRERQLGVLARWKLRLRPEQSVLERSLVEALDVLVDDGDTRIWPLEQEGVQLGVEAPADPVQACVTHKPVLGQQCLAEQSGHTASARAKPDVEGEQAICSEGVALGEPYVVQGLGEDVRHTP